MDNIHVAQELLRKYARKNISPRCILKVDTQKAYDTVDWDFLRNALICLNFPSKFVGWIMECVYILFNLFEWHLPWTYCWEKRTSAR